MFSLGRYTRHVLAVYAMCQLSAFANPGMAATLDLSASSWTTQGDAELLIVAAEGREANGSAFLLCEDGLFDIEVVVEKSLYNSDAFGWGPVVFNVGLADHVLTYEAVVDEGTRLVHFTLDRRDAFEALEELESSIGPSVFFDVVASGQLLFRITAGTDGLDEGLRRLRSACLQGAPGVAQVAPTVAEGPDRQPPVLEEGVWTVYRNEIDRLTAEVDFNGAELAFSCVGDVLDFMFGVPALDAEVAGLTELTVVYSIDPNSTRNAYSTKGQPFELAGKQYVSLYGPGVKDWAVLAKGARKVIQLGLTPDASGNFSLYNTTDFPARGSTAAIDQLLDECG